MLFMVYFAVALLGSICVVSGQDFQDSNQWLTLTGPDAEDMLACSLQSPLPLDTHISWYVDGTLLKSEFLPHGQLQIYESLVDLTDLLGRYPKTIECVINDQVINRLPGVSNKLVLATF